MAPTASPAQRPAQRDAGRDDGDPGGRRDRLRSGADISATVRTRAAAGRDVLVVHARDRQDDAGARIAVVAGRRVGGAVVRNRAKRRLRAALRDVTTPAGVDLVVTAKAGADVVGFDALRGQLQDAIRGAVRRARR